MLYTPEFDIAAFIITAAIIFSYYLRRPLLTKAGRAFEFMMWLNLTATVFDFVSCYTISFPEKYSAAFNYAVNIVYITCHALTMVSFLFFSMYTTRGSFKKKAHINIYNGLALITVIAVASTPLTKLVFYFDDNLSYCYGPALYGLYTVCGLLLIQSFIILARAKKELSFFQRIMGYSFFVIMTSALAIQMINKRVLVEMFAASVSIMMISIAFSSSASFMYKNTYCYTQAAFDIVIQRKITQNKPFTILAFNLDDFEFYKKIIGERGNEKLIDLSLEEFRKAFGRTPLYFLNSRIFALDLDDSAVRSAIEKIDAIYSKPFELNETEVRFTPYYAVFRHPGYAKHVDDVIASIENMMTAEHAKNPKKITEIYDVEIEDKSRKVQIARAMTNALKKGTGFDVYYQPIFHRKTGKYSSAEALLRFIDSDLGFVSPDEFIPIAEGNGQILEIGEMVFDRVCKFWADNNLSSYGMHYMEINISMMQLLQSDIADTFSAILDKYGLSIDRINLEITETASSDDKNTINANLMSMHEKGFTFSLDDYGSGYANLNYLAEMPFNMVKIDKDILWGAMKDKDSMIILQNTVRLIQELNKISLVEGVENEEMVEVLSKMGLDHFQGYYYSRPLPEKDFLKFLMNNQ